MITFNNKTTLNSQPDIANENKVTASDMNEIKSVYNTEIGDVTLLDTTDKTSVVNAINELKDGEIYSTSEVKTNKVWIDNKPIYRKVINFGALSSSASTLSVSHNINYDKIVNLYGICSDSNGTTMHIPHVGTTNMASGISISLRSTSSSIQIYTSGNGSSYNAYIIIEYTKKTD